MTGSTSQLVGGLGSQFADASVSGYVYPDAALRTVIDGGANLAAKLALNIVQEGMLVVQNWDALARYTSDGTQVVGAAVAGNQGGDARTAGNTTFIRDCVAAPGGTLYRAGIIGVVQRDESGSGFGPAPQNVVQEYQLGISTDRSVLAGDITQRDFSTWSAGDVRTIKYCGLVDVQVEGADTAQPQAGYTLRELVYAPGLANSKAANATNGGAAATDRVIGIVVETPPEVVAKGMVRLLFDGRPESGTWRALLDTDT